MRPATTSVSAGVSRPRAECSDDEERCLTPSAEVWLLRTTGERDGPTSASIAYGAAPIATTPTDASTSTSSRNGHPPASRPSTTSHADRLCGRVSSRFSVAAMRVVSGSTTGHPPLTPTVPVNAPPAPIAGSGSPCRPTTRRRSPNASSVAPKPGATGQRPASTSPHERRLSAPSRAPRPGRHSPDRPSKHVLHGADIRGIGRLRIRTGHSLVVAA